MNIQNLNPQYYSYRTLDLNNQQLVLTTFNNIVHLAVFQIKAVKGVFFVIHFFCLGCSTHRVRCQACFRVKTPMLGRPLALGAAGGSLTSLALRLLADSFLSVESPLSVPVPDLSCVCPASLELPATSDLDLRSVLLGVLIGLSLGPLLELLLIIRHWWTSLLRHQFHSLARSVRPLYREI